MIKCNKKIGIIIGIVIIALLMFIHPLLFKKNYIEKIAKIDLPKSANLIDSKFYVDLYGVQLPSVDKGIHAPTAVFWRLAALTSVGVRPVRLHPLPCQPPKYGDWGPKEFCPTIKDCNRRDIRKKAKRKSPETL